nr:MAG: hypothetical protein P1 [Sobemovirus sp.]
MTWRLKLNETIVQYPGLIASTTYGSSCALSGSPEVFPSLTFDVTWSLERTSKFKSLKPKPSFLKIWCAGCKVVSVFEVEAICEDDLAGYKITQINGSNRTAEKGRVFSVPTLCIQCISTRCTASCSLC